jgi:hypothetical protein
MEPGSWLLRLKVPPPTGARAGVRLSTPKLDEISPSRVRPGRQCRRCAWRRQGAHKRDVETGQASHLWSPSCLVSENIVLCRLTGCSIFALSNVCFKAWPSAADSAWKSVRSLLIFFSLSTVTFVATVPCAPWAYRSPLRSTQDGRARLLALAPQYNPAALDPHLPTLGRP